MLFRMLTFRGILFLQNGLSDFIDEEAYRFCSAKATIPKERLAD